MKFGAVVPHFGPWATRAKLTEGAVLAERLDYDSLWVRDHVVIQPHAVEGSDITFIDPFVTLAYLSGVTQRIGFGTATLIPFRHALHLARSVGSLAWVAERSLDLGVGAGGMNEEFELLGITAPDRAQLMRSHVQVARALWDGQSASAKSAETDFGSVQMEPRPVRRPTIWFGGCSPLAARMAAEFCDGWLPGRITHATFERRRDAIGESRAAAGLPMLRTGAVPLVSLERSRASARERIPVSALLSSPNRFWVKPASGSFESVDDLAGAVIAGSPDDILEGVDKYRELDCDLIVVDLRHRFEDWGDQLHALADILPLEHADRVAEPGSTNAE